MYGANSILYSLTFNQFNFYQINFFINVNALIVSVHFLQLPLKLVNSKRMCVCVCVS